MTNEMRQRLRADIDDDLLPYLAAVARTIRYQDDKYAPFTDDVGGVRLAVACLEDEVAEVRQAWRDERRTVAWSATTEEAVQVAAVAVRLYIGAGARPLGHPLWGEPRSGSATGEPLSRGEV